LVLRASRDRGRRHGAGDVATRAPETAAVCIIVVESAAFRPGPVSQEERARRSEYYWWHRERLWQLERTL